MRLSLSPVPGQMDYMDLEHKSAFQKVSQVRWLENYKIFTLSMIIKVTSSIIVIFVKFPLKFRVLLNRLKNESELSRESWSSADISLVFAPSLCKRDPKRFGD